LGPTFRSLAAFYGLSPEPLRRRMVAWRRASGLRQPTGKAAAAWPASSVPPVETLCASGGAPGARLAPQPL